MLNGRVGLAFREVAITAGSHSREANQQTRLK